MTFIERYSLSISLLSPVHIGCGEDFDPTSYVIANGSLCAFDPLSAATAIGKCGQDELLRAVTGNTANALLDTQRALYRQRRQLESVATLRIPVVEDVTQHYESRIGRVAQREQNNAAVIHRLEIARASYDPLTQLPLLPGSTLKGSIRTAILNAVLDEPKYAQLAGQLDRKRHQIFPLEAQRQRDAEREYKKLGANMPPEILQYASHDGQRTKIELERDPLRLLKVSDAHYQIKDGRSASGILWRVNHRNSGQDGKGMSSLIEALNASPNARFQAAAYRGEIAIDQGTPLGKPKTPNLRFELSQLIQACNSFYRPKLEAEIKALDGRADPRWLAQIQAQVLQTELDGKPTMGHLIETGKGFLLRVGRHSGGESVTLNELRRIYIRQHNKFNDTPFTRWLAASNRNDLHTVRPFGWVFIQPKKI